MKKASTRKKAGEIRPECDLARLEGGVRGNYYREAVAGTNLVLIEPELADVFPDAESVNRALRLLADTAGAAVTVKRPRKRSNRAIQPAPAKGARG